MLFHGNSGFMNVSQRYLYTYIASLVCFFEMMINSLFGYDSENFNTWVMLKSSCGDNKDRKISDINFRYSAPGNISFLHNNLCSTRYQSACNDMHSVVNHLAWALLLLHCNSALHLCGHKQHYVTENAHIHKVPVHMHSHVTGKMK